MLALHFLSSLGREMMFKLIKRESDMNVTCDMVNSKLSCLPTQGPCAMGVFSSFSKTKTAMAITKGKGPAK